MKLVALQVERCRRCRLEGGITICDEYGGTREPGSGQLFTAGSHVNDFGKGGARIGQKAVTVTTFRKNKAARDSPFTGPDGTVYTFDHLKPIDAAVSVTVHGRRYSIPVVVILSNHCFTDGKNNTVQRDDELYILTDGTGHRAFCEERYRTSLNLPASIRERDIAQRPLAEPECNLQDPHSICS